jgi:tetratricopeptide (TPR) repeat protein
MALLVERRLDGADLAAAQVHLDDCEWCRAVAAALVRREPIADGSTTVVRLRGGAASPAEEESEANAAGWGPRGLRLRGGAASPAEIDEVLEVGDRVGRYVVVDVLGKGGMGTVYAAFDPDLDRKIALKVLRRGTAAADDERARMQREAQALARVSHPSVVAVHDVGTHDDRVFIAMEFVAGGTSSSWLRERARTWREVVALLAGAGRGLAAAHAAGLVHRDIKPDNILVDAAGRARVSDFGLAFAAQRAAVEATQPDLARHAVGLDEPLTRTGAVVGTPAYMAPEQLSGQVVTARSDQFSFCATVYEALYGVRPYPGTSVEAIAAAMRGGRIADPPSDRGVPKRVRAAVVRGLAIDPAARHPSMEALLAALDRAPRHRRWIAAAAGVVALGGAAAAGALVLGGGDPAPCGGGEAELATAWSPEKARAVRVAFTAVGKGFATDEVDAVIERLDTAGRAWVAGQRRACEDTRVRRVYDEAVLALRVDCYAAKKRRLGAVVDSLVRADAAVAERALDAATRVGAMAACDDVAALRSLTPVPEDPTKRAAAATLASELDVVEGTVVAAGETPQLHHTLEGLVARARVVDHAPLLARSLLALASVGQYLGDEEGAIAQMREAIAAADRGKDDRTRFLALAGLIAVVGEFRRVEARELVPQAEAALARVGLDPELEVKWMNVRASHLLDEGDPRAAAALYLEIATRREQIEGPGSPQVADPLMNAAFAMTSFAPPAEALAVVRRAIAIYTAHWGARHPKTANARSQEALILEQTGQAVAGIAVMEEVLAVDEAAFGPDNPRLAADLSIAAGLSRIASKYDDARRYYARSLAIREAALGPDHPLCAEVKLGLAQIAMETSDPDAALALLADTERIVIATMGADDQFMSAVHYTRGYAYRAQGKHAEALAAFRLGYAVDAAIVGADAPQLAEPLDYMAHELLALGRGKEAVPLLETAVALRETVDVDPYDLAIIRMDLARAYAAVGRDADARARLAEAAPVLRAHANPEEVAGVEALEKQLGSANR